MRRERVPKWRPFDSRRGTTLALLSGLVTSPSQTPQSGPIVWAIAGGKGGVGKSFITANLGVQLASQGQRVVLVDGDLGGANLDTLLGCPAPITNLGHFFSRQAQSLAEIVTPTSVAGLSLIAGDLNSLGAANPAHAQKLKLIRHLKKLDADIVIVDLGAGTTFNTLDLYLAADVGLVVANGEPTSLQNAFGFIKAAALRALERRTGVKRRAVDQLSLRRYATESDDARDSLRRTTRLVVNRAGPSEARRVSNLLNDLSGRFLGGHVKLCGAIHDDPLVPVSIRQMEPLCVSHPTAPAALAVVALAHQLTRPDTEAGPSRMSSGVNEEVSVDELRVHLQTEDLGREQGAVRTQAFAPDGRVLYSRRTPYVDRFFVQLDIAASDRVRFHHVAIRKALLLGRIQLTRKSA